MPRYLFTCDSCGTDEVIPLPIAERNKTSYCLNELAPFSFCLEPLRRNVAAELRGQHVHTPRGFNTATRSELGENYEDEKTLDKNLAGLHACPVKKHDTRKLLEKHLDAAIEKAVATSK